MIIYTYPCTGTGISLNNKIINESKISCINYKEIYINGIELALIYFELELINLMWNWN